MDQLADVLLYKFRFNHASQASSVPRSYPDQLPLKCSVIETPCLTEGPAEKMKGILLLCVLAELTAILHAAAASCGTSGITCKD